MRMIWWLVGFGYFIVIVIFMVEYSMSIGLWLLRIEALGNVSVMNF